MNKKRLLFVGFLSLHCGLGAVSLDGTTGTVICQGGTNRSCAPYAFSAGDYARGFIYLSNGFSVPAGGSVSLGIIPPVSGDIDLGGTGRISLTGDLTFGSNVRIKNGGKIDARSSTIYLNNDLTVTTAIEFSSDTVIDGLGHDIVFQGGGFFYINGSAGTTLTLRNCAIKGLSDYASGSSIYFGSSKNQKLVLNGAEVHLAGNYTFNGGMLDIKNFVGLSGTNFYFVYNSEYPLTIISDSTFFIDTRTYFTYSPVTQTAAARANLIVMQDSSSRLFLNGCTFYIPLVEGLVLTNGHLIVDHSTLVIGNGFSPNINPPINPYGLSLGNGTAANDILFDIMPGANFEVQQTRLHYKNSN